METGSILKRQSDEALFKVIDLAHWSLITRIGLGHFEEYRVKWTGDNEYISSKGDVFTLCPSEV